MTCSLLVIGEATKRLSQDFRQAYRHIEWPWQRIAGFRDVLIHDYLRVDLDEVWGIVDRNFPELKATIRSILKGIEG
ncbi:DUF86 domain-containing protein [Microcoleus sp. Pol11C3]|uniref:HepT-like ribonuclease domain-containing protein n=1 Tax=Microcoleus sp. Pol11C3 TaxID=3055390 RepID=UPI002FCF209D